MPEMGRAADLGKSWRAFWREPPELSLILGNIVYKLVREEVGF